MRPLLRSRSRGLQLRDRYNEDSRMTDAKQNQRSYPRLRRMQAFSELALAEAKASTTPTSPLTPTYLQASKNFAKTSAAVVDDQNIDVIPHELFTQPSRDSISEVSICSSIELLEAIGASLHHKNRSEDLRSRYVVGEKEIGGVIGRSGTSPDLDTASLDKTIDSDDTLVNQPTDNVHCVCRCPFDKTRSDMIMCQGCSDWFHLDCVGQGHRGVDFFEDHDFFCPACEAIAFQEIVEEEQSTAS